MTARTLIVLAAGRGRRLEPLTRDLPKCLAPLHGRGLLAWQLDAVAAAGVERVVLATGYRAEALEPFGLASALNPDFATTNMVESLWCARELCVGEVIVSYGDIVYTPDVLRALLASDAPCSVIVDQDWLPYWQARCEDPLDDAESLRADPDWRLRSVGQPAASLAEIQAQYIGLTRWSPEAWQTLLTTYQAARAGELANPWPREPRSWYFTDLLQLLIDGGLHVQGVPVRGQWLEVDTRSDLELAERVSQPGSDGLTIGPRG